MTKCCVCGEIKYLQNIWMNGLNTTKYFCVSCIDDIYRPYKREMMNNG